MNAADAHDREELKTRALEDAEKPIWALILQSGILDHPGGMMAYGRILTGIYAATAGETEVRLARLERDIGELKRRKKGCEGH